MSEEILGVRTRTLGFRRDTARPLHSPLTTTPSPTADHGLASHPVTSHSPLCFLLTAYYIHLWIS